MCKLKIILLIFFLFILHFNVYSQTSSYKFPGDNIYSKAKIYFKNNNRIEVSNLNIKNDHLTFTNKATFLKGEYDINDVYIIKVSEGTRSGEYALIGGAVSGVSAALSILIYSSDEYYDPPPAGPWILGFAAGGALIGAIVGANHEKWKTLYVNEHASILKSIKSNLCINSKPKSIGLQFSLSF